DRDRLLLQAGRDCRLGSLRRGWRIRSKLGGIRMQAAIVTRFGRSWALAIRDVPKPIPAAGEVLIRVHAATVNRTDYGELRHPILNRIITRARAQRTILGMDFAGEIEAVGKAIETLKPGDRVFGMCPL